MTKVVELLTIGRNIKVSFGRRAIDVPAKVDTGADSSSIWASNIRVGKDGILRFSLFGEGSEYYNGKIYKRSSFAVASVTSSSGHTQIRYRVKIPVKVGGKKINTWFNLSDRSRNRYPVLIGRRTLSGKFLVDVRLSDFQDSPRLVSKKLNAELEVDPAYFHNKYLKGKKKG